MTIPIVETKHLKKYFKVNKGLLHAVDDVDLTINLEETLGVVGESGCGKSTLGRVLLGLLDSTEGEVLYNGESIFNHNGK
jgi:peptide/nickel transport system ATP-binding protein